ncbi:MAG TPA: hypothetical protein H9714_10360 [Candidatus Flavonifractor intestinipullorum]|uniref:Uncharacterized protein n=1 Tax=Candidatus Flavonifractor intestinipullorum TaxID=2838587 RepID=A0A9D2MDA6_9FIRM|nr:hypothetical protein [Candidatus Flavonifractor intestinipullorum]
MYRCRWCGAAFEEPDAVRVRENLDGENGWWSHTVESCPFCGADECEEMEEDI